MELKELMDKSKELDEKRDIFIVMIGSFLLIGFVCALRGNETFFVEYQGLQRMIDKGWYKDDTKKCHMVIPLLGRFKDEDGER